MKRAVMSELTALLGVNKLLKGAGEEVNVESLASEGSVLGLYFSAHWCPPCK